MSPVLVALGGFVALVFVAAASPGALHIVSGGAWAVSRNARGADPVSMCVANPAVLAQWEHRAVPGCRATILSETPSEAVVDYRCRNGDLGHSKLSIITPRTIRIETQGIHDGGPFNYQLHARRLGLCAR